ncbi:DNA helicase [Sandaracinobacter neustonicus]|uniref:DNA helicase n=1 Tax=Sandaracinobacter neustonicus TaxID=1715348 RepID=A0A501XLN9_9SPHN|nr:DNA helicase [Sandaracinobacter neustonicus]TPE61213.1 DNA helicase [Sandaracinobacter neustonicus]
MKLTTPVFRLKRQARQQARATGTPLHAALDRMAHDEGFRSWGHLSASLAVDRPSAALLQQLRPGDLMLLGGRPGNGKTLMGLSLAAEAASAGRPAYFFTLEDSESIVRDRLRLLGFAPGLIGGKLILDTSDAICAQHMIERIGPKADRAVAVIDYLQLLDQRRRNADLSVQVAALREFAEATGSILVMLSQIDRVFDSSGRRFPERADIRLPNPIDTSLFTRACFLRAGEARLQEVA